MDWILLLVLLACPLMHLWMMKKGGHGHGNHKKKKAKKDNYWVLKELIYMRIKSILTFLFPNIFMDFVDDLNFDGKTKWLKGEFAIKPRKTMWDSRKVSAGAPPIKTKDGWLLIYNAVGNQDSSRYKIGAMLLDLKNPTYVLHRTNKPILEPTERYETEGFKSGIVYSSGTVVIKNQLFVYYGGADTVTCAARANLNEFLDQLKYSQVATLKQVINPQRAFKYYD